MSTSPGRPQRADQHKVLLHGHTLLPTKHIADERKLPVGDIA